jgi:hypothetical protein
MTYSICPGGMCPGEFDGVVVYRDSNHLTASFAAYLETFLETEIDSALGLS